jgi:hypothetical protein
MTSNFFHFLSCSLAQTHARRKQTGLASASQIWRLWYFQQIAKRRNPNPFRASSTQVNYSIRQQLEIYPIGP